MKTTVPVISTYIHPKHRVKDNGTKLFITGRCKILNGEKYCPRCSHSKLKEDFTKNKSTKDGLSVYCRKCNSIMIKAYRNGR